jgi:SAM-dependent methyltransferase
VPYVQTLPALLLARSIVAATRLGILEALADAPASGAEVAARAGTDPGATAKLLAALAASGTLEVAGDRFALAPPARRWLLRGAPRSLADSMEYRVLEWEWIARLDDFVRTGTPLRIHDEMSPEQWALYLRGMAAGARFVAPELVRRLPVPAGARDLLDLGGAHGIFAAALCRRHPPLRAMVLDLPAAVAQAAPILAGEGLGERVVHQAGDALRADLGSERWDVVLLSHLAHHFDEPTNRELVRRIAVALRPRGVLAIHEVIRGRRPGDGGGGLGALAGLYFALTSESGTFSFEELAGWQRDAGLVPRAPRPLRTAPGFGLQVAVKPRA